MKKDFNLKMDVDTGDSLILMHICMQMDTTLKFI